MIFAAGLAIGLASLFFEPALSTLPYNPTRAYVSPRNDSEIVYVFTPALAASSNFELLALNTTESMNSSTVPYKTISSFLPFLEDGVDDGISFVPSIDDWGIISVFSGNCSAGAEDSSVWRYVPNPNSPSDLGTWTRDNINAEKTKRPGPLSGSNYLATAITYSSTVGADDPFIYIFGGMCPNSSSGTGQSAAEYTNNMITLSTTSSDRSSRPEQYDLELANVRGPPIAEAGFSMTPLQPSYSNSSGENKSIQQDFVLLGGHTKNAFINMSQVALFSLPQQGWTFIPVDSPSVDAETDLSKRADAVVEPRSGHTAILSSDGQKIILFGGWVGDTDTPADPQLAILNVGEDYGGAGEWAWHIPSASGSGLEASSGLYGHGAVMLPGDVMMVIGGYLISRGKRSRDLSSAQQSNHYFLNVTSMEWISTYTPPRRTQSQSPQSSRSGALSSTSKKAGLGVGVALGAIIAIILAAFCLVCCRRRHRRRDARKKELEQFINGTRYMPFVGSSVAGGFDGRGGQAYIPQGMEERQRSLPNAAYPWTNQAYEGGFGGGSGWKENCGTDVERTGLLLEIPSPTRGLRRNSHSRTTQHSAARHDEVRKSHGSNGIHPIQEGDEEDGTAAAGSTIPASELLEPTDRDIISTAPILDPFGDPSPLGSHPIINQASPTDFERRREIEGWVSDWAAADAILHNYGRISPDKSDRTSSTLSDQSARSVNSVPSQLATSVSRSLSGRSLGLFSRGNPFSSHSTSPTLDKSLGRVSPPYARRTQSLSYGQRPEASKTNDSFATAQTSFALLQTEGEALLGESRPDHGVSWSDAPNKPTRRTGWMGSMRRALPFVGGGGGTSSSSGDNSDRSNSLQSTGGRYSPTKQRYRDYEDNLPESSLVPRRAASASAALWQHRQGAADWDFDVPRRRDRRAGLGQNSGIKDSTSGWDGDEDDDEEWDIEAAVERRVVQVMFTVPREKLRVVNADSDGLSVSEVGDASAGAGAETGLLRTEDEKGKDKGKQRADL